VCIRRSRLGRTEMQRCVSRLSPAAVVRVRSAVRPPKQPALRSPREGQFLRCSTHGRAGIAPSRLRKHGHGEQCGEAAASQSLRAGQSGSSRATRPTEERMPEVRMSTSPSRAPLQVTPAPQNVGALINTRVREQDHPERRLSFLLMAVAPCRGTIRDPTGKQTRAKRVPSHPEIEPGAGARLEADGKHGPSNSVVRPSIVTPSKRCSPYPPA